MEIIHCKNLKARIDRGDDIQVIDIREIHEVETGNIGALHIPMAEVTSRLGEIRRDCPVVIHCRSGKRAKAMVHTLEAQYNFENLLLLDGGIQGWAREIDQNLRVF